MTNGNIMCFNIQTGDQIQLRSERLFNQNILPNRQLFLDSMDFNAPLPPDSHGFPSFNRPFLVSNRLILFSGLSLTLYPLTATTLPPPAPPAPPVSTPPLALSSSAFLLSDALFLSPTRVYLGALTAAPSAFPLFSTLLYLLHVHEPALAAHLTSHLVFDRHTRALYTVVIALKQLQRVRARRQEDRGVMETHGQKRREVEMVAILRRMVKREGGIKKEIQ